MTYVGKAGKLVLPRTLVTKKTFEDLKQLDTLLGHGPLCNDPKTSGSGSHSLLKTHYGWW
jgi:hypothetical protein